MIGLLVDDPVRELRPRKRLRVRFHLAVDRVWTDAKARQHHQSADYFTVEAYGKLAEILAEYIRRGSKVHIQGRLRTGGFAGARVLADQVIMLGRAEQRLRPGHWEGA
ncbi:MAG: single-stranded DNA-binding protein [Deltaproteobacteria bacterium]|nr:single-stranded DNA-binding protein [Deltaproteobacteria bacterium]